MESKKIFLKQKLDNFEYSELLYQSCRSLNSEEVKFQFHYMINSNIKPTIESFGAAIGSCFFNHNSYRALYYISTMDYYIPKIPTYFFEAVATIFENDDAKEEAKLFRELAKKEFSSTELKKVVDEIKKKERYF
jgi:hypothetical protein